MSLPTSVTSYLQGLFIGYVSESEGGFQQPDAVPVILLLLWISAKIQEVLCHYKNQAGDDHRTHLIPKGNNTMKRKIITCIFIIAAFLLQSTIFGRLTFSGIRPNLLIAVTASIGFMRGRKEGMGVGFICGLLVDIFWGGLIGFYALIYTVIGYMNGSFQRMFYEDDIKLPLAMIGISDLIYSMVVYVCLFMLKGEFEFIWFLEHV